MPTRGQGSLLSKRAKALVYGLDHDKVERDNDINRKIYIKIKTTTVVTLTEKTRVDCHNDNELPAVTRRQHSLWAQRAKALVDGLDLDGIEGDELGRSDPVGLHVRQALEALRLRIHDDGIHKLHHQTRTRERKQTR